MSLKDMLIGLVAIVSGGVIAKVCGENGIPEKDFYIIIGLFCFTWWLTALYYGG